MTCSIALRRVLASLIATAGLALAMPAAAQTHTTSIGAACDLAKVGDDARCIVETFNNDGFLDSIQINEVWIVYDEFGDAVRDPAVGNLPIIFSTVGVICAPGPSLPCTIPPGGFIRFESTGYIVQPDDPDPVPNRAFVDRQDNCDGTFDPACSTNPNTANQAVAGRRLGSAATTSRARPVASSGRNSRIHTTVSATSR